MIVRALSLALLFAPITASAAEHSTNVVPVELHSFGYSPSPISLRAGEPVTMVFTNRANISHEFKAEAFFAAAKIVSGTVGEGEVDLKPGRSQSVTLVPARGTYRVHCGHFMHAQLGMTTTIYVQ